MKSISALWALSIAVLWSGAFSQHGSLGVGFGPVFQFPSGDFDRRAGFGYGALGGFEFSRETLAITARSGYIQHVNRHDQTWSFVPIFFGLKASVEDKSVYVAGEAGPVLTKFDYSGADPLLQNSRNSNLGWGVGVGSIAGNLDLRFSFHVWDSRRLRESATVGVGLGFAAWSL